MKYLNLIRYQNLLFIALVQIFIKFGLFIPFGATTVLDNLHFAFLVFATLCIAAAGNIINDLYDVEIDKINKPNKVLIGEKVSEKNANRLFIVLNILGVAIGFYLANSILKPSFAALFVAISALLYLYASYLKGILLLGNFTISILVAMSLIIVPIFDLLPAVTQQNQTTQATVFTIVLHYALFAFFSNLIREIVKDLQDINGDKKGGKNTLAIAIGRKRTVTIVFVLGVILVFGVVFYMYENLYNSQAILLYFLFAIVGPLLYFCIKAWDAKTTSNYAFLSALLKVIMFLGICSIPLYQFVILK
ncbi:geranylgeranylglycerol-phosphate geranylgeranyltransferase [Aequorivita flava]|uniref:Geranylgeranylglycerol-phosphate geranylgeranyltransferase n=1 Tax=Aequorivita flava TaxID=3114371 RepID=A0AB35YTS6_9FLAO